MRSLSVIIAAIVMTFAGCECAQGQTINFPCLGEAFQAAQNHQCSNPNRRFLCLVEKVGVGAFAYRECNGGSFGMLRARIAIARHEFQQPAQYRPRVLRRFR